MIQLSRAAPACTAPADPVVLVAGVRILKLLPEVLGLSYIRLPPEESTGVGRRALPSHLTDLPSLMPFPDAVEQFVLSN